MSNLPVSVIVSTYKRDNELSRALTSIKNQSFGDFEVIIVDDNADSEWNEKVKRIVDGFDCERFKLIQNEKNCGSATSRNIGIKAAVGEYVTFLDDDDEYLPEKIKKQYEAVVNANADYSLTDLDLFYENGQLCENRIRNYIKNYDENSLIRYHLLYHMSGTDTMMFKRDYLLKIGMFPPINVGDEYYLMMNAINGKGKLLYLDSCDVKAYVHTENAGVSSGRGKIDGENRLYEFKKQYFNVLNAKDKRYVKMRHFAVIAFAYKRAGKLPKFFAYALKSFVASPISCLNLLINIKK